MTGASEVMADRTEAQLSPARAAENADRAFETLVAESHERVRRLANRLLGWRGDAEDVVQDVFLAAFENRSRLADVRDRERWLTTITLNACRSRQRRAAVWRSCFGWLGRSRGSAFNPGDAVESDEQRERARQAVAGLPQTYREVVVLRYLEGMDVAEIAEIVGVNADSVAKRLSRARSLLREAMREYGIDEGGATSGSVDR